mmetsp:Transcript_24985/g.63644  ORF Transcript_24985/g.63644 Transcript_24985/m.63644 type:complete len:230 (+) Transcript_24985:372-1061(+)
MSRMNCCWLQRDTAGKATSRRRSPNLDASGCASPAIERRKSMARSTWSTGTFDSQGQSLFRRSRTPYSAVAEPSPFFPRHRRTRTQMELTCVVSLSRSPMGRRWWTSATPTLKRSAARSSLLMGGMLTNCRAGTRKRTRGQRTVQQIGLRRALVVVRMKLGCGLLPTHRFLPASNSQAYGFDRVAFGRSSCRQKTQLAAHPLRRLVCAKPLGEATWHLSSEVGHRRLRG